MTFVDALSNWYFWGYTVAAAVLLTAAWGILFWQKRRRRPLEDMHRLFWSWVILAGTTSAGVLPGHPVFVMLVALLSLFACKEFARATGLYADWLFTGLVYLAILGVNGVALWAALDARAAGFNRGYDAFMAAPIYAVAGLCLFPVVRNRSAGMLQHVALSVMAFVFFGYFLAHLSLLAGSPHPDAAYGLVFFLVYGNATTDLARRAAGHWLGRRPIAPRISAEITWEGAAASLGWACLWSFTLGWTLPQPQFGWPALLLFAGLFGVMGPLGNLVMHYILSDLDLKLPADRPLPYLALGHVYRLIFVAPFFFRVVHWFYPEVLQPPAPP
jgi:phosphatidate cytidylyltransferase